MDLTKNIVILAGVYADQFDIEIKINSQGVAATDGKIVYIPKPKPEYEAITWGYCAHEAGHVRDTDNDLIIKTKKENPFLGWMLNLVEDTRIERVQIEYFPGVKKHFDKLTVQVLKYNWEKSQNQELSKLLVDYVFYYIRGYIPNYPIWDQGTKELQVELNRRYNLLFMYSFNQLLDKARYIETTQDALELAKEILDYLGSAADEEDSDDDSQGGDSDDDSQGGDSDDDSQGGDSSDDSQGGDSSDDSQGGDSQSGKQSDSKDDEQSSSQNSGDNTSASNSADESASDDQSPKGQPLDDEAKEALKAAIAKTLDDLGSGDLGDTLKDILSDSKTQERLTDEERYALGEVKEKHISISQAQIDTAAQFSAQTTGELRNGLIRLIEDQTRSQRVTSRKGRRLAKGKVHRLITGDTRIFKRKFTERDEISCDVAVLADYSYSMGSDISSVKTATYALLDCLSKIEGANTCAYGFGGTGILEIQKPNQSFDMGVKGRIFSLVAGGGTPATEAYWAAIQAFRRMDASKKVAIMVTDGEPNDQQATFNMVQAMKKQGIRVIAVGVGVDSRAHKIFNGIYGSNEWVYVQSFGDLPRELLRVAKEVI
ncbi:vWA domain-containing protein [Vibrio cyclitrophicus]|uniref:vWA domain-containing protein n=1 Tax=Vibrio cyclitrophicus TaxID=47951 RepID=UPI0032E4BB61